MPGSEVKLLPVDGGDGRYELRMRGPHVFAGYIGNPELTAAAFDEEGFFRLATPCGSPIPRSGRGPAASLAGSSRISSS